MYRFIALLRAINAGPRRAVKMEFLRRVFESMHLSDVATFIGSGNIVFKASTNIVQNTEDDRCRADSKRKR